MAPVTRSKPQAKSGDADGVIGLIREVQKGVGKAGGAKSMELMRLVEASHFHYKDPKSKEIRETLLEEAKEAQRKKRAENKAKARKSRGVMRVATHTPRKIKTAGAVAGTPKKANAAAAASPVADPKKAKAAAASPVADTKNAKAGAASPVADPKNAKTGADAVAKSIKSPEKKGRPKAAKVNKKQV